MGGLSKPPTLASLGVRGGLLERLKAALILGVRGLLVLFCLREVIVAESLRFRNVFRVTYHQYGGVNQGGEDDGRENEDDIARLRGSISYREEDSASSR